MHRDAPDYEAQAAELETKGYDPAHLREVHADIEASFGQYFDSMADAEWKLPLGTQVPNHWA